MIEETAGQEDIADIFTMNVIVELICLNSPKSVEVMVMAGQFIRRCPETWKRFSEAVVDPTVLTSQKIHIINETVEDIEGRLEYLEYEIDSLAEDGRTDYIYKDWRFYDGRFTFISLAAAGRLALRDGRYLPDLSDETVDLMAKAPDLNLHSLTSLSDAAAESLSKHKGSRLDLSGLTELSDAAAESLSKHKGDLNLGWLTSLSDAAAESLSKHEGGSLSFYGLDNLPASAAKILRDAGHGE